jgi:hypothetical protein
LNKRGKLPFFLVLSGTLGDIYMTYSTVNIEASGTDGLRRELKTSFLIYASSCGVGLLVALLCPSVSEAWMSLLVGKIISDPWSSPLAAAVKIRSPFLVGLWIFLLNFPLGSVLRFFVSGILFYVLPMFFAVTTGFGFGLLVGAPTYTKMSTNIPPVGLAFFLLYLAFESSAYIVACAIGYRVGRESQKGLSGKALLKTALIAPLHLKEEHRRLTLRKELKASVPWLTLCGVLTALNAIFETAFIILFG